MNIPFIPYFQTTRYRVTAMVELAAIQPGEKTADLGSGDGRIVIAMAQAGATAVGYELDATLIKLSEENIQAVISRINNVNTPTSDLLQTVLTQPSILHKDFWQEDLSQYDVITVYPMPDIMERLEKKLIDELKPGSRVLLNYYPFPNWQYTTTKDHIYLYTK